MLALRRSWGVLGRSWTALGWFLGALGRLLGALGRLVGTLGRLLGPLRLLLSGSGAAPGCSWALLGTLQRLLGALGRLLGALGRLLAGSWPPKGGVLALPWRPPRLSWAAFWVLLAPQILPASGVWPWQVGFSTVRALAQCADREHAKAMRERIDGEVQKRWRRSAAV